MKTLEGEITCTPLTNIKQQHYKRGNTLHTFSFLYYFKIITHVISNINLEKEEAMGII
jgi:hypothetical protein